MRRLAFLLALLFAAGCGKQTDFDLAKKSEKLGRYATAISHYETFVQKNPKHSDTAEAYFNMGEIYRTVIKDYPQARLYFEKVSKEFSGKPIAVKADEQFMNCPDYFPLDAVDKKVMGDSSSGGDHMHTVEKFEPAKEAPGRRRWTRETFAGDQSVGAESLIYEKKDRELREFVPGNPQYSVALRYPLVKGLSWESLRRGKRVQFSVVDDACSIEVRGGIFVNCLKVKEESAEIKSTWKYNYYAPGAGLVLTSIATEKAETRIVELLSGTPARAASVSVETKKANKFYISVDRIKSWFAEITSKIKKRK